MNKFIKISLATAIALVGTISYAQPLEEAIKNVDVSGSASYRYDDITSDNSSKTSNNYKATINLKSKVNEDVIFNTSLSASNPNSDANSLNTGTQGDENFDIEVTKLNFTYTGVKNTSITLGKQSIQTPWTASAGSAISFNEQTGTGILAVNTTGPVTFVGAYFNQTNFDQLVDGDAATGAVYDTDGLSTNGKYKISDIFNGSEDIYTVGVMATVGPVTLDAWYLALDGDNSFDNNNNNGITKTVDASFDSFTVGAKYSNSFGGFKLGLDARHTQLEFDSIDAATTLGQDDEKSTLSKLTLTGKSGMFFGKLAYGVTDKDGGLVALDKHSKAAMVGWLTTLNGQKDTTYIQSSFGAQFTPKFNVSINYHDLDSDATDEDDVSELYLQSVYKMSKNLSTLIRLGSSDYAEKSGTNKDRDQDAGRLHITYTF